MAAGARVITQAVATKVLVGTDDQVTGVEYLRWSGDPFPTAEPHTVTARRYVLAAHSVENAKLLLMSGAANTSDQVGRNLMDHPFLLSWARTDEPLGVFRGPGSTAGIETLRDGPFRAQHSSFRTDIDNWGFQILGSPGSDVDVRRLRRPAVRHRPARARRARRPASADARLPARAAAPP